MHQQCLNLKLTCPKTGTSIWDTLSGGFGQSVRLLRKGCPNTPDKLTDIVGRMFQNTETTSPTDRQHRQKYLPVVL